MCKIGARIKPNVFTVLIFPSIRSLAGIHIPDTILIRLLIMESPIQVLYVDRGPYAERVAKFLEQEDGDIAVETATSTVAGLEYIADTEVDCLVSGYDLPDQSGLEFLATIREYHPELPFIL